jgi:hypothetical protein
MREVELKPFTNQSEIAPGTQLKIRAGAEIDEHWIQGRFRVDLPQADMSLKLREGFGERKDELWKATCFELFIQPIGHAHYWEMNVAPSGDWNVYFFSDYRLGMQSETRVSPKKFSLEPIGGAGFHLSFSFAQNFLAIEDMNIRIGLSCVWLNNNLQVSYWAREHAQSKPDFHNTQFWQILKRK